MANNNTLESVLDHLKSGGVAAEHQKETGQIVVIKKIEGFDFPLFIRFLDEGKLLQLIAFIPCNIKPETIPDLGRLLHVLNKEMDMPGFGMDEQNGMLFYRAILPTLNNQWDKSALDTYMKSIDVICRTFTPVISNVCQGVLTFDAVMNKARNARGNNA